MTWEKDLDRWLTTPPEPKNHPCLICQFDVYDDAALCEDCQNEKGGMNMNNLADQLKNEFMERYGLRPDQVRLEVSIYSQDLVTGKQILNDFDRDTHNKIHSLEGKNCGHVFGKSVNDVFVHTRDGFNGTYLYKDDEEE